MLWYLIQSSEQMSYTKLLSSQAFAEVVQGQGFEVVINKI